MPALKLKSPLAFLAETVPPETPLLLALTVLDTHLPKALALFVFEPYLAVNAAGLARCSARHVRAAFSVACRCAADSDAIFDTHRPNVTYVCWKFVFPITFNCALQFALAALLGVPPSAAAGNANSASAARTSTRFIPSTSSCRLFLSLARAPSPECNPAVSVR